MAGEVRPCASGPVAHLYHHPRGDGRLRHREGADHREQHWQGGSPDYGASVCGRRAGCARHHYARTRYYGYRGAGAPPAEACPLELREPKPLHHENSGAGRG